MQKTVDITNNRTNGQTDVAISVIRLIALLMIILCHLLQYYGNELAWWFNVGVQIFFVISGYLYERKTISNPIGFIVKQAKKILLPYYCYIIPVLVIYWVFAKESMSLKGIVHLLTCSGTINGLDHLWFIPYILFCYAITPFLENVKKYYSSDLKSIVLSFFSIALICCLLCGIWKIDFFRADRLLCYVSGYYMHILVEKYKNSGLKLLTAISIITAGIFNSVQILVQYVLKYELNDMCSKIFGYFTQFAHASLGIMLFLVLYCLFKNFRNHGVMLRISDKCSYHVYVTHHIFIIGPFSVLGLTGIHPVNLALCCVSIVLSTIALYYLVVITNNRLNGQYASGATGPR